MDEASLLDALQEIHSRSLAEELDRSHPALSASCAGAPGLGSDRRAAAETCRVRGK